MVVVNIFYSILNVNRPKILCCCIEVCEIHQTRLGYSFADFSDTIEFLEEGKIEKLPPLLPLLLYAHILPLCASTILFEINNPNPVPVLKLVVITQKYLFNYC